MSRTVLFASELDINRSLAQLRTALQMDHELPPSSLQWLADVEQAVTDMDPSSRRSHLLKDGYDPGWQGPFGQKLARS